MVRTLDCGSGNGCSTQPAGTNKSGGMMLTRDSILKIPTNNPGALFDHDPDQRKIQYHTLIKQWHPDITHGDDEVFIHIQKLYQAAEAGKWDSYETLSIRLPDNKGFDIKYLAKHEFELGAVYVSSKILTWFIKKEYEDLARNGIRTINNIKYPDERIKKEHQKYIPIIKHVADTEDGLYIVMSKDEDLILLDDLIKHLGRIPPKHMAWMVSSLLNILCFYQITGLTHNGLTTNSVLVNTKKHAAFPFGGWWYAKKVGSDLKFLPPKIHAVAPPDILAQKITKISTDLASVKLIARTCIGDSTGAMLNNTSDIPKPLANWLRLPPHNDAIEEYTLWGKVLKDSWGPRRFLELNVDPSAIYKQES